VGEEVAARLDGLLVDPEVLGSAVAALVPSLHTTGDWQDIELWRQLTRSALVSLVRGGQAPLVVPMTVVDDGYLEELLGGLLHERLDVVHFTLVASAETIQARLAARDGAANQWARDRVDDCVARLAGERFARHVEVDDRSAIEAADVILESIG